jgi:UDP:flavonoid glycosyltransferase YjiC (YdhE family)
LRAKLGLGDVGDPLYEGQFSPQGTLALFSSTFARPQPDWPPRSRVTGFVFHDDDSGLPDDLRAFLDAGDPPIVFTLGSSAAETPGPFYDESARAAETLGRRAVLLVGRSASVETRNTGRGLFISRFAPHGPLFARAAAVVHHGGIGTLGQAMRAGKPMLVVPHAHDQPDNALRAERMGIARVVPARAYRCARVARALAALCGSRIIAEQAAAIGRHVCRERGTAVAVQAILDVAAVGDRP